MVEESNKKNQTNPLDMLKKIINVILTIFSYIPLGAYYLLNFIVIKPITYIIYGIKEVWYFLFTSKSVKKDKELKLEVNFDEHGEETISQNSNEKNMYAQMKANQKKVQKQIKINPKQKEKLDLERVELLKMINDGQEKRFDTMQTFRYKALSPEGKIVTDTFYGVSKLDIYTFLTGEGYTVFSIETSKWINFVYGQSSVINFKLSTKDLIFFITQLLTYIKAGITLTEAMRIISKQLNKNKSQQAIMQSIVYYLTTGETFSSALAKQKGAFPSLVINMIKAAEATGNLEEALEDLNQYYTEVDKTKKQMVSAISYPALVGAFSLIVIVVIMIFIVPKFIDIYDSMGATLNSLTAFVISFSNFLQHNIFIIIIVLAVIVVLFIMAFKNIKPFKRMVQTIVMKIPVFGKITIYNELTIFTKTFASLLKNDVFITDSIDILRNLTNNEIYKEIMINTITNLAKGEKISESFKNHWAIPDIAYYMLVTGENTGQLDSMMAKVSEYYQEQHRAMVNSMKSLIEPMMIIFLAVVVGGVLIAVILPIFQLYGNIM